MADFLHFLGTAGARFAVSRQLRLSGGLWLSIAGKNILLDPGPATLFHAVSAGFNLQTLDAVIVSHRHIDHSTDANVVIEAMCNGGRNQRGVVFAPSSCLDPPEPVVFSFIQKYPSSVVKLKPQEKYEIDGVIFKTSIPHRHGMEVYGFVFERPGGNLAIIVDTAYFPALIDSYKGARIVVANVVLYPTSENKFIPHLHYDEMIPLIQGIKPEILIMTHFGKHMIELDPSRLAAELSDKTGIEVIAAYDGMRIAEAAGGKWKVEK